MVSWPILIPDNCPFTFANLPFGVFSTATNKRKHIGVAIGDFIIDLSSLEHHLDDKSFECLGTNPVFQNGDLERFASLPAATRRAWRETMISWLNDPESLLFKSESANITAFVAMKDAIMHLPFAIGAFTDFMCSDVHVENCSILAGASTPQGYYNFPLGYNGRASSVIVAGQPVHRPQGIVSSKQDSSYTYQPSSMIDYEAEIGILIGKHLPLGEVITADQADEYIFGFVSLNDWSARDIQFTEMVPLGPLNGKSFATSISPWVVTLEAMEPHRCPSTVVDLRDGGMAKVPHLCHQKTESTWDLEVEVSVLRSGPNGQKPLLTSHSKLRDLRWSPGQMLAHLSSSGCGLKVGDIVGTGTISSPGDSPSFRTLGCLFELTDGGKKPAATSQEECLFYLKDGDEVLMDIWSSTRTLGFGNLRSQLLGPGSSIN
ncbi:fumarylacetoacetate hydrolase [Fusarium langsethiae]|uniref:Fumarylacetoacetase n=1 Tax=Fusarium langsethiae TaxID=179993 RepID=A0A0N0DBF6_FUSLA|nr:fumarylacetoacetate hydrolase [Fusarium langsethiae]GKU06730.1 unnamed protein product [Fusarium langsethiae]GKU14296.1 unnamed protein product [Fusarium langsethiae]